MVVVVVVVVVISVIKNSQNFENVKDFCAGNLSAAAGPSKY